MNWFILTRVLFFILGTSIQIYWWRSFQDKENKIYKVTKIYRKTYKMGMLLTMVACATIMFSSKLDIFDINMFLIGCIVWVGSVALWDKK